MSTSTNRTKKGVYAGPTGTSTRGGAMTKSKKGGAPISVDSQSRMRKTIYGGASRTLLSSSSRKNVQLAGSEKMGPPSKAPVQVLDEQGQDVTPLPLLHLDPSAVPRKNQSNILADSSTGTPTDLMSQASIYQTGTVNASTFGGGLFTRSVFSASQSGRSTGSVSDDLGEPSADMSTAWAEIRHHREEVKEDLTEEDLDREVDLALQETPTIWLLDLPAICVSTDGDEAPEVEEQNTRYKELVRSRVGNDRYAERGMNTFNEPLKIKSVQTNKITYSDSCVMATNWDMFDTYQQLAEKEAKAKDEDGEIDGIMGAPEASLPHSTAPSVTPVEEKKDSEKSEGSVQLVKENSILSTRQGLESQMTMSSMAGTDSVFASKTSGLTSVTDQEHDNHQEILQSEKLLKTLVTMERVVNLNTYQPKLALYRSCDIIEDIDQEKPPVVEDKKHTPASMAVVDMGPNVDRLWVYQCPLTAGRNVSFIAWNKINPDLLAVGYGEFEFINQRGGLVCCWSLKNPEYPERVYTCHAGVCSMDFSQAHPNLLAVGLYDGTVAIYNVRSTQNETVLDSFDQSGKHTGPVWQLKWIEKERGSGDERAELLVSTSTDGRVTQWSIRKGLESYDLMKLKRVSSKQAGSKAKKSEAFISRFAGGLCFDFSSKDSNIYLAGTEEGLIHKCSCSYNEQYLENYIAHTGPIYCIQWSPFIPDVFLSSSGDWTIKLWHQDRVKPILSFHSSTKAVHSVCWSPRCSTVFACVNEGAVEVWDLTQSTLDPLIVCPAMAGTKLSFVTFSRNSECILVGCSDGTVSVYQLRSMPPVPEKQVEMLNKVIQSSLASQLQK